MATPTPPTPPTTPTTPTRPTPPTALEQTATALHNTLSVVYRRIKQTVATGDLTLAESSTLAQLRHGPQTSADLAKRERISPQAAGTTVAALEQKGLITRAPDPADGRRQILSLTPAGRDTVTAKRSRRARQIAAALEQLTPQERERIAAALPALEKLAEHLPDHF